MAKRSIQFNNLVGPGIAPDPRARAYVEIAPAYSFVDGVAINWPVPLRATLSNGAVLVTGIEDTYIAAPLVWAVRTVFEDSRGKVVLSDLRTVLFPAGVGVVGFASMLEADLIANIPGFGPTWAAQAAASAAAAEVARVAAVAARVGAEAVGSTNDAIIAGRINTIGSQTEIALAAKIGSTPGGSTLVLGTTADTAKAGNYAPTLADIPAGSVISVRGATRPTARTNVIVMFINATNVPIVAPPSLAGMYDGVDIQIKTAV